jgi:DNA repair protein RadA/Sms
MGFCPQCGTSEPLVEEAGSGGKAKAAKPAESVGLRSASDRTFERQPTGWGEIDRVLGGGIVAGSVLLLGGEPGVGKSTLLLQMAGSLARSGESIIVASAEESADQVALRASRLGIVDDTISLVSDDDVDAIVSLAQRDRPRLLIVDSIQTVGVSEIGSAPGGVAQVR